MYNDFKVMIIPGMHMGLGEQESTPLLYYTWI